MKILVTGGTGVIGTAAITALLDRGHSIRLLSRNADQHAPEFNGGVEPFSANLSKLDTLAGCADGCNAVLHIAGIVAEAPPERTFERVNVEGAKRIVEEAERSGISRLVFVSSLGADRGQSEYHRSKLAAEKEVAAFSGSWAIGRPGSVYGPGDVVISVLLQMVRSLPVIPILDHGDQPFQPVWHVDLADALASLLEDEAKTGTFELAGVERTSMNDLIQRLAALTGRDPARLPVPSPLASLATRISGAMGIEAPINEAEIQMLLEGNVIEPPENNALPDLIGRPPTSLEEGLKTLSRSLPEQPESEGVGDLLRKRFFARVKDSEMSAAQLCSAFKARWTSIIPLDMNVEPGEGREGPLEEGLVFTMALPGRGNIQVRCKETTDRRVSLVTLEGHPLAGKISFGFSDDGDEVLFEILIEARAANLLDLVALKSVGEGMQNKTWQSTVEAVVELSGGYAPAGVESEIMGVPEEQTQ